MQAEEGLPIDVANGNFGATTKKHCPQIPYTVDSSAAKSYSGQYYTYSQISAFIELMQFALYVNGFGSGIINGVYSGTTQQDLRDFQSNMQSLKQEKLIWAHGYPFLLAVAT